ncbi:hypothetical protein [Streptomyces sp. NPDC004065]|uniref:hypothetical protein n=1 Tax=Streptomyces sp. NPDC004065 TaxID=3364689 RepID=UPI00384E6A35
MEKGPDEGRRRPEEDRPEWPEAASATGENEVAEGGGGRPQSFPDTGPSERLRAEDPWGEPEPGGLGAATRPGGSTGSGGTAGSGGPEDRGSSGAGPDEAGAGAARAGGRGGAPAPGDFRGPKVALGDEESEELTVRLDRAAGEHPETGRRDKKSARAGGDGSDTGDRTGGGNAAARGGGAGAGGGGFGRDGGADGGPVFVDMSGRRSRRFRRFGMAVGLACAVYGVVIVVTLVSGNSNAPWLPVPGQAEHRPSNKVDTSPAPSDPRRPPGTGGGGALPGAPVNTPGGVRQAPGTGPSAPPGSAGPSKPGASVTPRPSASGSTRPPRPGSTGPVVRPTPSQASPSPDPSPSGGGSPTPSDPSPSAGGSGGGNGGGSGSGPGGPGTVADGRNDSVPVASEPPRSGSSGSNGSSDATGAPGGTGTQGSSEAPAVTAAPEAPASDEAPGTPGTAGTPGAGFAPGSPEPADGQTVSGPRVLVAIEVVS